MWKFVTRGIRETLERRGNCRTNVYSQTSPENGAGTKSEVKTNLVENQKFLVATVASRKKGFCGSAKSDGPKDKKYHSDWNAGRSWSEAVGWSSVLAVGWVVCQSLCLRRRLFEHYKEEKWRNHLRLHSLRVPLSFVSTFDHLPRHVLPVTNCVANSCIDESCEHNLKQEWSAPRPYGPITIEEALKEAKDDYTATHRLVVGEFELRFGIKALDEKRYYDAVKHFSTGASLSSSGSMFNLGLCHELGIGTVVNTIKAAKYYKYAAEKGHRDAMYNLGVFHAQGRGGLSLDIGKARELFIEAANLGQAQAQIALDLEKNIVAFASKDTASESARINFTSPKKNPDKCRTGTFAEMSGYDSAPSDDEHQDDSSTVISYYDDNVKSVQNSTDIFLNCLGIETNLVKTTDSHVPCCT